MRLIQRLAVLLVATLVAACSLAAPEGETVAFDSATPKFIDDLLTGAAMPAVTVNSRLMVPSGPPPWPAVVLLHSASGQGAIDWAYADLLLSDGFAVLAVDSFLPRGAFRTVQDQTEVSEVAMVLDAFAARDVLAADPRIDPERIAVVGFSKGGIAAFYASLERVRSAAGGVPFAAHVAHYPWCGLRLRDPVTTGAPILIQAGSSDTVTPVVLCQQFVDEITAVDPDPNIELVIYEGARHAFDHPALSAIGWLPVSGMLPGDCLIVEQPGGDFLETSTGQAVSGENLADVLTSCGRNAAEAGGDSDAADLARDRLRTFLAEHLQP
ncbi:MAG: hypothetical protein HOI34_02980 [Rhodospirillaceae bacterium]|nr:hypothetical protein [Rhodospirillaceae bacterium]MBT6511073.1 hypothetical protein [Rhodospirillaceae bacterium]MBT7614153.1 hypothetical protein [Rhodospirillaceae bacterium]MBT7648783.1 hypothetical protein [Rhodospirillaceae bacterium]